MTTDVSRLAFSPEASVIARVLRESGAHLTNSATFSKDHAYSALHDVWTETRKAGWDGADAAGIEQVTYQNARRFIEALPLGYPLPSAGAEPDGHLTLEWYLEPKWTLSVSISPEGTVHYAALFGNEDPRGSCQFFGEIPETVLFLIRWVFYP